MIVAAVYIQEVCQSFCYFLKSKLSIGLKIANAF